MILTSSEFLEYLRSSLILMFLKGLPELQSSLFTSLETVLSFGFVFVKLPEFLTVLLDLVLSLSVPLLLGYVSLTETRPFSVVMLSEPSCRCCDVCAPRSYELSGISPDLVGLAKLCCEHRLASAILAASFSPLRPPLWDDLL